MPPPDPVGCAAAAEPNARVYQSYPQARAGFWPESYRRRFDLAPNIHDIPTVRAAAAGLRVLYTFELGDSVERWWADPERTVEQVSVLDPLAGGRFLVWANDLVAHLSRLVANRIQARPRVPEHCPMVNRPRA
ncbi:MAG TPA: hypothetical protein VGZ23_04430 [bacterium]|nr:hypothetical protein [bacterium]